MAGPAAAVATWWRRRAKNGTSRTRQYMYVTGSRQRSPISVTVPPKARPTRPCASSCRAMLTQSPTPTAINSGG